MSSNKVQTCISIDKEIYENVANYIDGIKYKNFSHFIELSCRFYLNWLSGWDLPKSKEEVIKAVRDAIEVLK